MIRVLFCSLNRNHRISTHLQIYMKNTVPRQKTVKNTDSTIWTIQVSVALFSNLLLLLHLIGECTTQSNTDIYTQLTASRSPWTPWCPHFQFEGYMDQQSRLKIAHHHYPKNLIRQNFPRIHHPPKGLVWNFRASPPEFCSAWCVPLHCWGSSVPWNHQSSGPPLESGCQQGANTWGRFLARWSQVRQMLKGYRKV